jgi:soluble lytic murein transglycosylase-like protein
MTAVIPSEARALASFAARFLAALGMTLFATLAPAEMSREAQSGPDPELRKLLLAAVNAADSFDHPFDAEVWLADMSDRMQRYVPNALTDPQERLAFLRLVHSEARRANVPPELVLAVIEIESRFDRFAISRAGALGYMQVMPFWLKELDRPYDNLFKATTNLRMGCTILKYYLDREQGDLVKGLARYNGSTGRAKYSHQVLNALSRRWFQK